jgi:hypothetical protein
VLPEDFTGARFAAGAAGFADHAILGVFVCLHVLSLSNWRGRENQKPGRAVGWGAVWGAPQDC